MSTELNRVKRGNAQAIINFAVSGLAPNTQVNYAARLEDFLRFLGGAPPTYATAKAYRDHLVGEGLGASSIKQALSAVKRLALELRRAGLISRDEERAINELEGVKQRGTATHLWLSAAEARLLLDAPDRDTVKGQRDAVALSLLLGCALRREEAANVTWGHVQRRGNATVLANLVGKGNRTRTVPLPPWVLEELSRWRKTMGTPDPEKGAPILLQVDRWGNIRESGITPRTVYNIVAQHAAALGPGLDDLAPHDLRRTWARLAYDAAPERLDQISLVLGHESMKTTEIYMGLDTVDVDDPLYVEV